jgi:alcohol dehydrogenase (NADP+)
VITTVESALIVARLEALHLAPVNAAESTPTLSLTGGAPMPSLGLGTWKSSPGTVGTAVRTAIELGYRHIDCAAIYGNEAEIGAALASAQRDGVVRREELWITSKLWNDCHSPEQVRPALAQTLADLQLEQLDLYLIHWPVVHRHGVVMPSVAADQIALEQLPLRETWSAMEALVDAGLVRHIGVSNCSAVKLNGLLPHCRIRPVMNQIERHPWLQQNALLSFCQQQGIAVTAYSPLGSPAAGGPLPLLSEPVISAIATAHDASPAQVLLAWGLACGTAVIPKSVQDARLAANLAAAQLKLSPAELEQIATLDRHHRFVDGSFWELPQGPYTQANLWDEPD